MGFWDAVASAGPYANNLHLAPAPQHSIFTGRMLFLTPSQQCQSTEGTSLVRYWVLVGHVAEASSDARHANTHSDLSVDVGAVLHETLYGLLQTPRSRQVQRRMLVSATHQLHCCR